MGVLVNRLIDSSGARVGPEHQDMIEGARLAAIAVACAVISAGLVIAVGETVRPDPARSAEPSARLIRASR